MRLEAEPFTRMVIRPRRRKSRVARSGWGHYCELSMWNWWWKVNPTVNMAGTEMASVEYEMDGRRFRITVRFERIYDEEFHDEKV